MAKKTEHETLGIDPGDALELGTPEPNQLATATEYHSFEGETDASDIQIPYLKLWQASCDEAKLEEPIGSLGAFLLNGLVVAERNNPLECIVLKARKFFREYIPNVSPAYMPRRGIRRKSMKQKDLTSRRSTVPLPCGYWLRSRRVLRTQVPPRMTLTLSSPLTSWATSGRWHDTLRKVISTRALVLPSFSS